MPHDLAPEWLTRGAPVDHGVVHVVMPALFLGDVPLLHAPDELGELRVEQLRSEGRMKGPRARPTAEEVESHHAAHNHRVRDGSFGGLEGRVTINASLKPAPPIRPHERKRREAAQPFHVDEEQPRAQMVIAMNTGTAISFEQLRPHGALSGWRTG